MPEIYLPEKIIFGRNQLKKYRPESCEHAILICDSDIFLNRDFLEKIRVGITKMISQVSIVVNHDIHELYNAASDIYFKKEADLIIAAGSAASIDCGMLLSHESKVKFTAIPCCSACAMTDFEHGEYSAYRHSPDTVILDPDTISNVASDTVAYDGMACFSYAIDAIEKSDNIITKSLAMQGAVGIINNIISACRGDIQSLERLMYAMYFAVVAHRNVTDLNDSCLNKISRFFAGFGYPKTAVCGVVIPNVMENNEFALKESLFEIAKQTGISHEDDDPDFAVSRMIDAVRKIQASLGIPRAISGFGLNENEYLNKKSITTVSDDLLDLCYYGSFKFMKL